MDRPASIVRFEQFYLGHIVVGLVGSSIALFGSDNPATAQMVETFGAWVPAAILGLGVLIQATLWCLISRKGSAVAKWILVGLTALNLLGAAFLIFGFVTGFGAEVRNLPGSLLNLAASALLIAAVAMMFRPDTPAWFGEAAPAA
ncbi:MAG: hypothetical protein K2Y20_04555 [Sphingomonas sp.]|nr:hypothetical protein [Sphingomonas sp.]